MMFISIIKKTRYMQYLATLSATLSVSAGTVFWAWTSPSLPKLTSADSPMGTALTPEEASWVASIVHIGVACGTITSAWIILSRFGRKTTLLMSGFLLFFPWIAVVFAKSALTLCIARLIGGFGEGMVLLSVSIYIAEISDKDIRGRLGSVLSILRTLAGLFIFTIGPFVSYTVLAICCSVFALMFAVTFWFMPESPYYLVKTNQMDQALENIIRLSAHGTDKKVVQAQLDEITRTVEHDMKNRSTVAELLTNPEYRQSLIVMTGIKLLQHFSGAGAVVIYFQTIMAETKSIISAEVSSVILGVVQIPAALLTVAIVDKVGRKPLLLLSAIGCAVSLAAVGIYFYLQHIAQRSVMNSISWLPITAIVIFVVMTDIGIGTIPYVFLGELFPTNVKESAVALFLILGSSVGFCITKLYEPLSNIWGIYTTLWIFAGFCIIGTIFIIISVPETKGLTFLEIQNKLNTRRSNSTT